MERCPKCQRLRVEYDAYQQRRVCTNPECDWRERPEEARKALLHLRVGDGRQSTFARNT